jgi:hypothetical protein
VNCTQDAQQEGIFHQTKNSVASSHFWKTLNGHYAKKIDDLTSEKI